MYKYNMEEIFMEKKLFKRSLTFAMMIAVVFSTIIASSFIKANAAETEKAVTLIQGEKTSQYDTVQEAVAAVSADNTQAVITLNKDFDAAVQSLKSGETINIQVVPENSTLTIPEGVTVTNKTNNSIVVNGSALNAGENIIIQPEQPEPTPTPEPEPTPDPEPTPNPEDNNNMTESNNNEQSGSLTSPQTGNDTYSILYISLAFASAALLTIVSFTIRKMSKSK